MFHRHLLKIAIIGLVALLCISGQVLRKDLFVAPSAQSHLKGGEGKESQHVAGMPRSAAYRAMEPQKDGARSAAQKNGARALKEDVQEAAEERKSAARKLLEGSVAKQVAPKEKERSRISFDQEAVSDRKSAARRAMEKTSDESTKSAARKVMEEVYRK